MTSHNTIIQNFATKFVTKLLQDAVDDGVNSYYLCWKRYLDQSYSDYCYRTRQPENDFREWLWNKERKILLKSRIMSSQELMMKLVKCYGLEDDFSERGFQRTIRLIRAVFGSQIILSSLV